MVAALRREASNGSKKITKISDERTLCSLVKALNVRDFDVLPPSSAGQIRRQGRHDQAKVASFADSLGMILNALNEQEYVLGVKVSGAMMDADSVKVRARRT